MEANSILPCDVLIHVALDEEHEALLRHVPIELQAAEPFERYKVRRGSIRGNDGTLRTLVFLVSGEVGDRARELGALAARAFSPEYVINAGISGIVNGDAKVGDIVLPVEFMNYAHRSKAKPKDEADLDFEIQLGGRLVDADLQPVNDIKQLYTSGSFSLPTMSEYCTTHEILSEADRIAIEALCKPEYVSERPKIISGQAVAGPFVAKSQAFITKQIRAKVPDALAIDMESAALADALRVLGEPAPRFVSIRAISDPGDQQKEAFDRAGNGAFRRWAIANIATVLTAAIRSLTFVRSAAGSPELDSAASDTFPEALAQTHYVPQFIGQSFASFELNAANIGRFPNLRRLSEGGRTRCSAEEFVDTISNGAAGTKISLRAPSGSGKSALLYLAFRNLNAGNDHHVAFYLDLELILKATKPADLQLVADSLKRDIGAYLDRHPQKTAVALLFDGCAGDGRERDVQNAVRSACSNLKVVTVFAEGANPRRDSTGQLLREEENYLGGIAYEAEFELKAVSLTAESEAKALIVGFLNSIPSGKAFISAEAIFDKLRELGFDYVTHFVVSLFLENYMKPAYRAHRTASQFIESAMTSLIPVGQSPPYEEVCIEALRVHSQDLFDNNEDVDQGDVATIYAAIFARQPRLVQTTMIARAVIWLFSSVGAGDSLLQKRRINRETFLQIVFDNDVNSAIKHFMLDPLIEKTLLNSAKMLAEELDIDSLSFSLYLLGRITSPRNRAAAVSSLQTVRGVLESAPPTGSLEQKRRDDLATRYERLAMRSLYISLANHGDQEATDTYISKLFADPLEDILNRGFHLEYYGDRRSDDIGVDLQFSDDHQSWHRTSSYLMGHIRKCVEERRLSPINQIRLVTYLSFIRARHEARLLPEQARTSTLALIESLDECCDRLDGNTPRYVDMIRRNLQHESFDTLDFIMTIYALKGGARAGWKSRNILVHDRYGETVAAHSFGCALLAEFLIDPRDETWSGINVSHVRTLTLLHDIGEFSIGDYLPQDKSSVNEAKEIDYISTMGCYNDLRDLAYVRDLFNEFEAQTTREARLARELDKMDALIQAYVYKEHFVEQGDYQRFMREHFQQVHTPKLRNLVSRIVP
ncbi:MAG TPA: HD domain-containing protein [Allosphingosinicella sp.]